ncbi:hypothetical protein Dsin_012430 [Dipteronia sinensis]|uniref:Transposase n=1 Tax=Dipteronia sinensis TaxID=43782 RepID=A0AAE0AIX0_9ROSI|nr:hypothetical protein Dsin_012430 [Dipteronia sinensis]
MDFAHTADNIFAVILSVLETYGITHRIISITLDNASANTRSITLFTERNIPQAGGYFFHQRCACHIINLVVQSGLKEVIHQIVEMSDLLNTYREDDMLDPAVVAMETKFKKYWSEMPFLYALGVIVDHRIKLAGLEYLLEFIGNKLSVDYSDQITDILNKLFEVFSIYERRFLKAQFDANENTENFDLLLWWKTYSYRYPVLSHLALDMLVIPCPLCLQNRHSTRVDELLNQEEVV